MEQRLQNTCSITDNLLSIGMAQMERVIELLLVFSGELMELLSCKKKEQGQGRKNKV